MNRVPYLLLVMLIAVSSCKRTKETVSLSSKIKSAEDFNTFYNKFHADSTFQMSRIKFPLEGHNANKSEGVVKWNKANWIMHRTRINQVDKSVFKVEVTRKDNLQRERIFIEGGEFNLQREFKCIKGKWYLTQCLNEDY